MSPSDRDQQLWNGIHTFSTELVTTKKLDTNAGVEQSTLIDILYALKSKHP